jgi:DNA-binding CsgD family transcriptional regulator
MVVAQNIPSTKTVADRLGAAGVDGWQPVPHVLFRSQRRLGLTATELIVLLNITLHRRIAGQRPFVQSATIAMRMGITQRKVQRAIKRLIDKGLVRRVRVKLDGRSVPSFDVEPLFKRLAYIARSDPTSRSHLTEAYREAGDERLAAEML